MNLLGQTGCWEIFCTAFLIVIHPIEFRMIYVWLHNKAINIFQVNVASEILTSVAQIPVSTEALVTTDSTLTNVTAFLDSLVSFYTIYCAPESSTILEFPDHHQQPPDVYYWTKVSSYNATGDLP